ncbi:glycerophosphodiester phosphodiesterase family protein [Winogradskya humida]|uniref:GP-PDE domain-containing protein n=1 Tax=Winogradskya humida TaxID=113566 RepID=A0ABQ3ZI12_9ACTN|nr:glycerophosphodiester phosphodiesterase family protein [Actinoplanes humidus]GIE18228.1 hypothetical protein Ahu01nite_013300 [Actinoplanes humidus]
MASTRIIAAVVAPAVVLAALGVPEGAVAARKTVPEGAVAARKSFDLQAHRGGIALRPENTLASFGNALRLGVSTLELDVQITKDGAAVVTHDRKVDAKKCGPAFAGRFIKDLTLAEVRTMDCGGTQLAGFPTQVPVPGARMPLLSEVFDLVHTYDARGVKLNVETKVEAGAPQETAPREQFVRVVAAEVRRAGLLRQVTVQSFDWGALMRMGEVEPRLPLVALTNRDFLQTGLPGASPWLGGLDIDDFGGDPIAAIRSFGADALSPVYGWARADGGYDPYVTAAMVSGAHRAGIKVVPWTVDDPAVMADLIRLGVDGLITDYPDRLRTVLAGAGFALPRAYPSPFDLQAAGAEAIADPDVSTLVTDSTAVFSAVRASGRTDLRVAVELGPGAADHRALIREINRSGLAGRVSIRSYDWRKLPGIPTTAVVTQCCRFRDLGTLVKATGATTVSANWRVHDLARPSVSVLQRRDHLKVIPWGADDEQALQHVIDLGADGVVAGDRDLAILVARRNGLR